MFGLKLKVAALIAAGTVALGAGAAMAANAAGGSQRGLSNVASGWGQKVEDRVEFCKSHRTAEEHGNGHCVGAFAKTHGKTVSAGAHERNDAREDDHEAGDHDARSHGKSGLHRQDR